MATLYRIVDKETLIFKRDDFKFNKEIEIAVETVASQGLKKPKLKIEIIDDIETYSWIESE